MRWMPARTSLPRRWNSGPRWSMVGRSIARRTRSGTLVGPGICRKCLPARFVLAMGGLRAVWRPGCTLSRRGTRRCGGSGAGPAGAPPVRGAGGPTTAPPDGKAILTINTDVTLYNIEFSGAAVADGNGAGIRYQGGNLVLDHCYFHDNQDGLLAASDLAGSITITNSEFAGNGNHDG